MRNLAAAYHPKNNFWEHFGSFKDVSPFAELYNNDKSKSKKTSSLKMWAICLIYDPESDYYQLPKKEEKVIYSIEKNHNVSIKLDDLKELTDAFYEMTLSQADRSLLEWERRMKERDTFLKDQKWSFDTYDESGRLIKGTADQLDKMHSQTAKHFLEYEKIYNMVQELKIKEENARKKSNVEELDV